MSPISTVDALEQLVGERPAIGGLKSITFLDDHAVALLERSTLVVVGVVGADGRLRARTIGGSPGFCAQVTPLAMPLVGLDAEGLVDGAPVATLALVPGYGETLRVNGRLRVGVTPTVEVDEVFLHCAKAIIRSKLWSSEGEQVTPAAPAAASPTAPQASSASAGQAGEPRFAGLDDPVVREFLARSRFVALCSVDGVGAADVSPKGDPAAFVQVLDSRTVAIPDRPGNLRTDTLHNLVDHPELALVALVAGDHRVLELRGRAHVTDRPEVLAAMEVAGKVPKAAIELLVDLVELRDDPALRAAELWDATHHIAKGDLPRSSRIWTDHVRLNEDPSELAIIVRELMDESALAEGLEQDYQHNLY